MAYNGGAFSSKVIPWEVGRNTRNMINLTKRQKDILIGTILGDAYLQKTGQKNARLRLEHGAKQKEYIMWKVGELGNLFQGKPKSLERIHPVTKKTYSYWRHQSQSTPYLGKLRKIFYPEGRKTIPNNLEKYMSWLMLATWYMDDGYYYQKDGCGYIYLGNVSKEEANIVNKAINKMGIDNRIYSKKKGYAIYFPVSQMTILSKKIKKYIIPSLMYKIPS